MRVSGGREKNRGREIWLRVTSDEVAARYEIPNKKQPKKGFKNVVCGTEKKSPVSIVSNPINSTKSVASAALENASLTGLLVSAGAVHSNEISDMPVDPNEPTYCLCNQVSYGEMIGYDNPDVSLQIQFNNFISMYNLLTQKFI
uniref:Inhibitor of growth protein 4 n=1 Tax=Schizaphis graminum TaxID=13262 RepID=A0A2S2P9Y6_SCHGA